MKTEPKLEKTEALIYTSSTDKYVKVSLYKSIANPCKIRLYDNYYIIVNGTYNINNFQEKYSSDGYMVIFGNKVGIGFVLLRNPNSIMIGEAVISSAKKLDMLAQTNTIEEAYEVINKTEHDITESEKNSFTWKRSSEDNGYFVKKPKIKYMFTIDEINDKFKLHIWGYNDKINETKTFTDIKSAKKYAREYYFNLINES